MKKKIIILSAISFAMLLSACFDSNNNVEAESVPENGIAKLHIHVGKIGALSKIADINLAELHIELSSPGQMTIYDTIALTGHSQSNNQVVYTNLASQVIWTATVESIDEHDVIIHAGSTTFVVPPGGNVDVSLVLDAIYAMLKSYFFPIRDSVNLLELIVDSMVLKDSSFNAHSLIGDTVLLEDDYLTTGVEHDILLRASGTMWGFSYALYEGDTVLNIPPGVDTTINMTLYWVGPDIPPVGQTTMTVTLGAVGTAIINGELAEESPMPVDHIFALTSDSVWHVIAHNGGGGLVDVTALNALTHETFAFIDINGGELWSGDEVYIETYEGFYLTVDETSVVSAGEGSQVPEGIFVVEKADGSVGAVSLGDEIAIRTWQDLYLSAEDNGGGPLHASSTEIGNWETFILVAP